ncbi:unnamed protein product, partial [Didymodactylos carnosus]
SLPSFKTVIITKQFECLNFITGKGLQVKYRFPRDYNHNKNMVVVELTFSNKTNNFMNNICFVKMQEGITVDPFSTIERLKPNGSAVTIMKIDFNDKNQSFSFDISLDNKLIPNLIIKCQAGDLIEPRHLNEEELTRQIDFPVKQYPIRQLY